jgi:hypothetical protein
MAGPLVVTVSVKRRWFFTPLLYACGYLARFGVISFEAATRVVVKGVTIRVG